MENIEVKKVSDYVWEIPKSGDMNVPGRIYGDKEIIGHLLEDIKAGKEWNALAQIKNVACLPGIQKASMAMADVHPGYGFPIGGVGAFDVETGVIAVGGIGFDINCLTRDSKVLTELGYFKPIQDFEEDFTEVENSHPQYKLKSIKCQQSLVSFDLCQKSFFSKNALYFMKRKHFGSILQIKTKLGYTIQVTDEHPILTKTGMAKSGNLVKGQEIAVHPFKGVEYQDIVEDKLIIDGDVYTKQERDELRKRNLSSLSLKNPKLPILVKLFGYLLGDGSIYLSGKKGFVNAYGPEEDLKSIQDDIKKLGFSAKIYSRGRDHSIPTKYGEVQFSNVTHELHVPSKSLAKLFFELGYPQGEKTITPYAVPEWIMESPLWVKRLFLSGFFGAELSSPRTHTKTGFDCPTVSINKNRKVISFGREFAIQIMSLLEGFGVSSHKLLHRQDYFNKHGPTDRLKLQISSEEGNLIRLWSNIGFSYNKKREALSQIAILYIKEKKLLTKKRTEVASKVKDLKKKGLTLKEVQKLLESPTTNKRFIERHYYQKAGQRITLSFSSFKEFAEAKSKEIKEYGCFFDGIETISKEQYDDYVYDFNIPETHSFVADCIVVSNCGVRTLSTKLTEEDINKDKEKLADTLFKIIPAGLGSKGDIKLALHEIDEVLVKGAKYAVDLGYGFIEDLEFIEENGCVKGADPANVSQKAKQRQFKQIGTLGSGNHYLEVQVIDEIYDEKIAKAYSLSKGQVMVSIHCGSRGLGHQIGTDYLEELDAASKKYKIPIRERELVAAPFKSNEGQRYFSAVNAGINCAFANRQALAHLTRKAFNAAMGVEEKSIKTFYEIGHNTAKLEEHEGMEMIVHRKGSTRAFGPGRNEVPSKYRSSGQPVLVGGTMGTCSFILAGTEKGMEDTFGSAMHGAGRSMSRNQAMRQWRGEELVKELAKKGIIIKGHSLPGVAEEAPGAYKDVTNVVEVMHNAGIVKKVVKLKPLISIKG